MQLPTTLNNLLLHIGPAEGQVRCVLLPVWFRTPLRQYTQTTGTVKEDLKTFGDDLVSLPCGVLLWVCCDVSCTLLQKPFPIHFCKNVKILQHACATSSKASHKKLQSLILCIGTTHCRVLSQLPGGVYLLAECKWTNGLEVCVEKKEPNSIESVAQAIRFPGSSIEPSGFVPRKAVLLNKPVTDREAKGREGATWGTHIFTSHWARAVFYYIHCIMWMTEWHWHHLLLLRNICCKRWGDPVTSNLLIFIGFLTAFLGKIFVV